MIFSVPVIWCIPCIARPVIGVKKIDKWRVKKTLLLKAILIILWVHLTDLHLFASDGKQIEETDIAEKKEGAADEKRVRHVMYVPLNRIG